MDKLGTEATYFMSLLSSDRTVEIGPEVDGDTSTLTFHPAIFISDAHLGTKNCNAGLLLDFLKSVKTDHIYLVGDFFDNWRPLGGNWKDSHHAVVRHVLEQMQSGVRVTYTPGNHDEFFRKYLGQFGGNLTIVDSVDHTTSNGTRYLVTHGDSVDVFSKWVPFVTRIGARIESLVQHVNATLNWMRRSLGMTDWLGINYALSRFHRVVRKYDKFEERLSQLAIDQGADGVICGHFHQPALHKDFGVIYANCGDWVENCTALVETTDGSLELVDWGLSAENMDNEIEEASEEPIRVGV